MINKLVVAASCVGLVASALAAACDTSNAPVAPPADAGPADTAAVDGLTGDGSTSVDAGAADAAASDTGVADAPTVTITREGGTPIALKAFGNNYWDWLDWSEEGMNGMTGTEQAVTALHLNVIRAGGDNNDTSNQVFYSTDPVLFDNGRIDAFVQYCRTVGAEPILQVPIVANNEDGGATSPQTAADIVTYVNVTQGYGVKYWEIGNEPDLYASQYDAGVAATIQTAAEYCTLYQAYATAMKAANAQASDGGVAMQFLGPELSNMYVPGNDWLTPFLDNCKDYVDIVTVHRYPFSATQVSPSNALKDVNAFRVLLSNLWTIVNEHARPGTPLGITEANISWDWVPSDYTITSQFAAPNTYYGALWVADEMGAALENNLWTLAFWNLGETAHNSETNVFGFVVGGVPTPEYWTEQMVSANLTGTVLSPANVPGGFSVYASYNSTKASTSVIVINKNDSVSPLSLAVDTLPPQAFGYPATSVTLVTIPDDPTATTHVVTYTPDLAAAPDGGLPPKTLQ
ncbi:MAG: hypothetical protein ABTD50_04655 [Polyangiaceae bacterium]